MTEPSALQLSRDIARVVNVATELVLDHAKSCQASLLLAEKHVRARATERYGLANAWHYFADPNVLALGNAIRDLGRPDA